MHGGGAAGAAAPGEPEGPGEDAVTASVAGTLVAWKAEEGAVVEKGEPVAVLEAMKMETVVRAHRSGTITRGQIDEGATVQRGQVLATITD